MRSAIYFLSLFFLTTPVLATTIRLDFSGSSLTQMDESIDYFRGHFDTQRFYGTIQWNPETREIDEFWIQSGVVLIDTGGTGMVADVANGSAAVSLPHVNFFARLNYDDPCWRLASDQKPVECEGVNRNHYRGTYADGFAGAGHLGMLEFEYFSDKLSRIRFWPYQNMSGTLYFGYVDTMTRTAVNPEPSTLLLFALGLPALRKLRGIHS